MKMKLFFALLIMCLLGGFVSSAFAASTMKRVGVNPFYRPPLTSEADLAALVKSRNSHIRTGFTKAGYPDLYPAFSVQFPSATIDSIKVLPGEKFQWMLFRKKGSGPVIVAKDVTWGGAGPLDAYRFYIDSNGKRHEFVVLNACGNLSLRNIAEIPAPMPAVPEKAAVVPAPAPPEPAPLAPMPAPVAAPPAPVPAPEPAPPAPMPAAKEIAPAASVAAVSAAKCPLVVDAGFYRQNDPASYLFARVGYEIPLVDKLSFIGFVGGSFRIAGEDGGSAFIADAMLDYHWWNRLSFGLGAGYWSGDGGHVDAIANLGFLLFGNRDTFNGTLFIEGRSAIDEMDKISDQGRFGLGMRFRF